MTDPFYLQGLVRCCGMPMWSVTRHNSRRYRCATCGHGIDALTAEVEVWERACERNLSIGDGRTPYEKRRDQLTHHLDHVDVVAPGPAYHLDLHMRPTQ